LLDFQVIYTPGTVRQLLPFAITLLEAGGARFTLVDNGCSPIETEALRGLAREERRLSYLRLPGESMHRHGKALDLLLKRTEGPWFAILDSDVIASGDYLADLDPPSGGCAGVFTAPPVWLDPPLARGDRGSPFLGGPVSTLPDGTPVGATAGAIYDRAALKAAVAKLPRRLLNGPAAAVLAPGMAEELRARGWYYRRFGTARVANLRLLLDGYSLRNVVTRHLHHVGGISHQDEHRRPPVRKRLRRFADRMLHGERSPLVNALTNSRTLIRHRSPEQERQVAVRRLVIRHALQTMDGLRESRPTVTPPSTGIASVDENLLALHQALVDRYPAACARVESLFAMRA
jgi:hypothetical protein